jgi:DNA-binding IscR family transcriptional regulator
LPLDAVSQPAIENQDPYTRRGVRLGRPADQITLGEIYRSSIGDKPLWAPRAEGPRECLVTNHAAEYFARLTDETEVAVLSALAGRTLADSLDELRAIDRARGYSRLGLAADRPAAPVLAQVVRMT